MRNKTYKCLIIFVLLINFSYSQELVPPIQNFTPLDYGAASQNWDIAQDEKGVVYVANNQGLLIFDGINWDLLPLDNESVIRSVYPHNGRVYTGSYQEFGYWELTDEGCRVYNSLKPLMEEFNLQSEDFWEISSIGDAIYFRSFAAVYKYQNNQITRIEDIASTTMEAYGEKLVMADRQKGLMYENRNGSVKQLEGDFEAIENMELIDLETSGDTLFLGSRKALYSYHDGQVEKMGNAEFDELLARYELNHIVSVSADEIVIGTIKNGIIHYDIPEGVINVFDRNSGLQNNTVLSIRESRGRLLLALDKGIDIIDLNAPIHFYTDNTGELGAVYDVELFNGIHYLASNTGVYKIENGKLKLIEDAEDHTWNLEVINDVLYANHNRGTFRVADNEFISIDDERGSFTIKKIPGSDRLMIGDYTGLSIYDPVDKSVEEVTGVDFPVKQIVFENENTVWAAHAYEGLYRIEFGQEKGTSIEKLAPLDGNSNFNAKVYKVNSQVLIYVQDQWFKYNPFKDEIEKFEQLDEFSGHRLINNGSDYVFVDSSDGSIVITDLDEERLTISPEKFNHRLVKANENFVRVNDSLSIISLNDGFAYLNEKALKRSQEEKWISSPFIKTFSDDITRYPLSKTPVIPYRQSRNISIRTGMPLSDASGIKYNLIGEENLSGKIESGVLNLRNLKYGDYELQLSALGAEQSEPSQEFFFSIAPPWYFSVWMKIIYALCIVGIIYLVYWLNRQKLKKHQLRLEEKFEIEHAERLNRLEKERLMNEIDLKRKELANSTMIAAKKNEVLMEIQGELNKDKTKFSNQYRLKHIMNKINNAVKSKDEWQIFETNFNEVHEDFFKDLLEEYPKLTSKDLKLCSYLKMNLSSKEIAPLMGISVRGVEVHRYRLRKKMALESNVNLSKFLIKNF